MKKTTLLIAFIAILTSCSKDKDLLPVQQQPDNPSLRTSQDQHFLYNIEETHYNIKVAEFYQYHQNATYIPAEQNDIVESIICVLCILTTLVCGAQLANISNTNANLTTFFITLFYLLI